MQIFLSDSTLVMDSCWETYRLARWQMESDTTLRWKEDAAELRATIRSLNGKELVLLVHLRDGNQEQHFTTASVPYLCPDMKRSVDLNHASMITHAFRAMGTEPFWGIDIDNTGLRFRTPEDPMGIRWPPLTPIVSGDTLSWTRQIERSAIAAHIWPAQYSDGMSDRLLPSLRLQVARTTYRGCAESRVGTAPEPAPQ
jgi:uncharacterized membrane protein